MKLQYRGKTYDSTDIPLFIYFRNDSKAEFINVLKNYKVGTLQEVNCIKVVFAGSDILKDRRAALHFCIDTVEEKRIIQKSLFENGVNDDNAMLCSPGDISEVVLLDWIEKNLHKL